MSSLLSNIIDQDIYKISFKNNQKNSFSPDDAERLNDHLQKISEMKSIRGLLFFSANDKFFCAGGDLKYYSSLKEKEPGVNANKKIAEVLKRLSTINIPTVVCINGLCIGGGVELLSCFDYVITTNASLFSLWQRKVGLSFGWGGGERLSRRVSHQNLKNKFIEASPMTSYEALKINLVDQVVPSFKLEGVAVDWLNKVAALPKQALTLIKNNKIKDDEQGAFESLWLGKEHSVALNKFIKK